MSPPEKKKKKRRRKPSPQNQLPDDLLVSSLARVSRFYYPLLSLVSKTFRSLLASQELYQTRSFLGRTESCLYVCIEFYNGLKPRWYTLFRNPNRTPTNILVPISIPNAPNLSRLVAFGSNIYNIGGVGEPSAQMSILDCRSHIWSEGPNMRVKRRCPNINIVDGKIYVAGGCKDLNPANWMEVFDPKTQIWESVSCPLVGRVRSCIYKSAVIEGTIYYMFGDREHVIYKPMEDRWETEGTDYRRLNDGWDMLSYCLIDNILYSGSYGRIEWYDFEIRDWRTLKGMPQFKSHSILRRLMNYGGKMAVFWNDFSYDNEEMIHCAVFALERRNNHEICGKLEWSNAVLRVPKFFGYVRALAATV